VQRTKPPEKGLVKVVYSAKATEESNQRIDDAIEAAHEGRVEDAISELNTVLRGDSGAYLAAYNLGVLYDQIGELDDAASFYEKALAIEIDFSPAMLNLIRLEGRRGGDVLEIADSYVRKRPENLDHQIARLEALIAAGRYDTAVEDARIILKQDEANVRARYYMALTHFKAGRAPLASYIADQALKLSESDPELYFLYGHRASSRLPGGAERGGPHLSRGAPFR
jgi:tetratricopeptide (TPR) repeat protein